MNVNLQVDYTSRDYSSNLAALKAYVASQAPSSFTSFFEGDLGMVLLEAMAYQLTIQTFTLDMQTQESFLDTLMHRESLLHFARLTGYSLRRASAVSMELYCTVSAAPTGSDYLTIAAGTPIQSKDGTPWEVAQDTLILAGYNTPVKQELQFGDVVGNALQSNGGAVTTNAYVRLDPGSSTAVLCMADGTRWDSSVNFGPQVSQGAILVLANQWNNATQQYGSPPDPSMAEYAIIDIGQLPYDIYPDSILYLDRQYAGTSTWVGKWVIENRNVPVVQGQTHTDTFTVPASQARQSYQVTSPYYPVIGSSAESFTPAGYFGTAGSDYGVTVTVNNEIWKPTASLMFSSPDDPSYSVTFDELDRMTITFGDGVFGMLLPVQEDGTTSISVTYRTGGGVVGNQSQNSFDTTVQSFAPSSPSTPITVYLTNPYTVGKGGEDRESVQEGKRNIPQFVRTNDRAVTSDDYIYLASNFSDPVAGRLKLAKGVLHSNLVPREQNIIWLYCWVSGPNNQLAPPTYTLKSALSTYMNQRKMITDEVIILDGPTTPVPINVRYNYGKQYQPSEVALKVQSAINSVLSVLQPGQTLYLSSLYNAVSELTEINYVNVLWPTDNLIAPNAYEVWTNTLIAPVTTGLAAVAYSGTSSIIVRSATPFSVLGLCSIWQPDRIPTVAVIDSISGNVLNLRSPLLDSYTVADATVNASDLMMAGWSYERPVNVFIQYISGANTATAINARILEVLQAYFTQELMPGQTLTTSKIAQLVSSIQDVSSVSVQFDALGATSTSVTPSTNEICTLGVLTLNQS